MYYKVDSAILHGIDSQVLEVETDVSEGMPSFDLVGYLSSEVREAKERVRTAMKNSGLFLPTKRITVNLSPADIKKSGTSYDLPIALAIMGCLEVFTKEKLNKTLVLGELGLDGNVKPVDGVLPRVIMARQLGYSRVILPYANAKEGAVVDGVQIIGVSSLSQLTAYLQDKEAIEPVKAIEQLPLNRGEDYTDFSKIRGHFITKRAMEIAAAGLHNMIMVGPPGSGKTLCAKALPSIMPPLTMDECLEISKIYSVAGLLKDTGIKSNRPFVSPHHTASPQALSGGGVIPRPGAVSFADHGVLFLDELPEFKKESLEILRQPLEDKNIVIARANATYTYPADFLLIAAANPCRCGYYPDRNRCACSELDVKKYMGKISGPLMDRIDLRVSISEIKYDEIASKNYKAKTSKEIREEVIKAREIQAARFKASSITTNSHMSAEMVEKYCVLGKDETDLLKETFEKLNLSARSYHKIIKTSRTIADLANSDEITTEHIFEAISYRTAL